MGWTEPSLQRVRTAGVFAITAAIPSLLVCAAITQRDGAPPDWQGLAFVLSVFLFFPIIAAALSGAFAGKLAAEADGRWGAAVAGISVMGIAWILWVTLVAAWGATGSKYRFSEILEGVAMVTVMAGWWVVAILGAIAGCLARALYRRFAV